MGRARAESQSTSAFLLGNNNPALLKWTATTTISVICAISVGAVAAAAIAIVPPWHGEQRCAPFAGPPAGPATQKKFYHCFSQLPPSGICLVGDDTKYSSCYYTQVRTRLSLHNILTDTDVLWKGDSRIQRRRGSIAPVPETAFIASGADGTAPGDNFPRRSPVSNLPHQMGAVDATRSHVKHSDGTCHIPDLFRSRSQSQGIICPSLPNVASA